MKQNPQETSQRNFHFNSMLLAWENLMQVLTRLSCGLTDQPQGPMSQKCIMKSFQDGKPWWSWWFTYTVLEVTTRQIGIHINRSTLEESIKGLHSPPKSMLCCIREIFQCTYRYFLVLWRVPSRCIHLSTKWYKHLPLQWRPCNQ